ncbi:MAG: Uma2 family endonuclease [Fimbriimonadales bacterium]|nr:Uma2 family endonuclease [Fimbriimonadales bacterium]
MPTAAAHTKPRRSRAKRAPAESVPTPDDIRELQESLERLRQLDLPEEDGEPLESDYHVMQIPLLDELVRQHLGDTRNYFCGGNMFIYYSEEQAQEIIGYVNERKPAEPRYKGPDFFLVKGVDGEKVRGKWVVWQEGGKYPDLIIEVISPSTAKKDKEKNPDFYAEVFHTPEYFWYDQNKGELMGYRLVGNKYQVIEPNERGWLWSEVLEAYLGVWEGVWHQRKRKWLRLYDRDGNLVPTEAEREAQLREQERQRAEQAEAELERLKAKLREMGVEP